MKHGCVAVVDIGKTNAKLLLVAIDTGAVLWSQERANQSRQVDGLLQLDVSGLEEWLCTSISRAPHRELISHIVPVTHGAAAVLVDADGQIIVAPDYEDGIFEQVSDHYARVRDPFEQTLSPELPLGLNLGRQLYYLQHRQPKLYQRCAHILLYPQFWAWRLSGVMASEWTSLGCHTDLWRPHISEYSLMAHSAGWTRRFPPLRSARDVLGRLDERLRRRMGLPATCQVVCGIHDSNASYLCHLANRSPHQPFAVISSGTWVVLMAQGTDLQRLREERDMLANVDAYGHTVATARFMGGREYEFIAGPAGVNCLPGEAELAAVLATGAMALPSFSVVGGPFAGTAGQLINADRLEPAGRAALATLYLALMCDLRLDDLGAATTIVIDGPLTHNDLFAGILATLRPQAPVLQADPRAGTTRGGLRLAQPESSVHYNELQAAMLTAPGLNAHRDLWRQRLPRLH